MDSLLSTAARALATGDPLEALKRIALRDDPPAVALRGIAMAQLGDFARARKLLARAVRGFGAAEAVDRARCVAAQADIALASRDVATAGAGLDEAIDVLEAKGDTANALFARLVLIRRLVLLGKVRDAGRALAELHLEGAPSRLVAVAELVAADVATRELRPRDARRALESCACCGSGISRSAADSRSRKRHEQSRCACGSTPRRRNRTPLAPGRSRRVAPSRRPRRRRVSPPSSSRRHDRATGHPTGPLRPCSDTGRRTERRGDTSGAHLAGIRHAPAQ